jgi:hypothetical protein
MIVCRRNQKLQQNQQKRQNIQYLKFGLFLLATFILKKLNYIEFSLKVTLHSMFFDFGKYLKLTEIDQI